MLLLFLFRFNSVWNLYSFAFVCSSYLHYLDFSRVEVQKNCLLSCLLPCKDACQVVKVVQVTCKLIRSLCLIQLFTWSQCLFQFDSPNILIVSTLLSVITTVHMNDIIILVVIIGSTSSYIYLQQVISPHVVAGFEGAFQ